MSKAEVIGMLPPEIVNHAPLTECCPHCGIEMEIAVVEVWEMAVEQRIILNNPDSRRNAMASWKLRQDCPQCRKPIDFSVVPVTSYRLCAVAPDPLEKFSPNSRHWEAKKRGIPASNNLTLTPKE